MKQEGSAAQAQTGVGGSQTSMRGLDVIELASQGTASLADLATGLSLTRSTAHRLASSLVERGYLAFTPRTGYRVGAKLLQLGHLAQAQANIVQVARPYLDELALETQDTVHLGVLDHRHVLYLDKMPGKRRITISSRIGDRQPLTSTGLGKALMLDQPVADWVAQLDVDAREGGLHTDRDQWLTRMHWYVAAGRAFDLEENEDRVRCVAAPVRDATRSIAGALSVSSAAQYMNDDRMQTLSETVIKAAQAISRDLGWSHGENVIAA